jgi:hypothetical protein
MSDGCLNGGFNVIRRDPVDELMIMNDFSSNVNLVINGEALTQSQLVEKLYYGQSGFDKMQNNEFVAKSKPFKREIEISDEPKPLEPGQIDPNEFFGSSLSGFRI